MFGQRLKQQCQGECGNGSVALQDAGFDAIRVLRAAERILRGLIGQHREARRGIGAGEQLSRRDIACNVARCAGIKGKEAFTQCRRRLDDVSST
jgi:hypothetical protein